MARLLVTSDETWYDELNTVSYYGETEYERAIRLHIAQLFPDYYAFTFKKAIRTALGNISKPDLGLLKKDLKEWWVVEVELAKHSLEDHVLEQIDNFRNGKYPTIVLSDFIKKQILKEHGKNLNDTSIKNLLNRKSPKILVIVDQEKKEWADELNKRDVMLCEFQVFKNSRGRQAYRLNGRYPLNVIKESHCLPHKIYGNNLLEIKNPKIIGSLKNKIDLYFLDRRTKWIKFTDRRKVYLKFIGKINALPANATFLLVQDTTERFIITIN